MLQIPIINYSTDYVFDGMKDVVYVEDDANPQPICGKPKWQDKKYPCDVSTSASLLAGSTAKIVKTLIHRELGKFATFKLNLLDWSVGIERLPMEITVSE